MSTRREPGEIEFWNPRLDEWIPNKKVCYVSDNELCSLNGCNRKVKHTSQSVWKGGPQMENDFVATNMRRTTNGNKPEDTSLCK